MYGSLLPCSGKVTGSMYLLALCIPSVLNNSHCGDCGVEGEARTDRYSHISIILCHLAI